VLNPDSDAVILESKQRQELEKGDVISLRLAGGGGYGNPAERDPSAVLEDVLDEFVSQEEAERLYGVVLDLHRRTVGKQATADARTRLSRGGERSEQ
jgi:N-methylhydantoinase B